MVFNKKFRGGRNNNDRFKRDKSDFKRGQFNRNNDKSGAFNNMNFEKLSEVEVGITEYITSNSFDGVIKQRFSDFQVNEIDMDGNILQLTNYTVPTEFKAGVQISEEDMLNSKSTIELISDELWEKIKTTVMSTESTEPVELDVTNNSKDERSKIHRTVKDIFGRRIITNTLVEADRKKIVFKKFDKLDRSEDVRVKWPENFDVYVHFALYKECMDTMEACYKISDCLKMKTSNLTYAGVKDRRAKTTQWCCVYKVNPKIILEKTGRLRNVKIGNFAFKKQPLKLGQLKGNQFRIALRNVTIDDEVVTKVLNEVKEKGFINYYGLQRFGQSKEIPTHSIGVQLLRGNWKEACDMILKVKNSDDPKHDITKAKQCYQDTQDLESALKLMVYSKNKCIEWKLMQGLLNSSTRDYVNALENIPRNTRLLYLHAFQSLVWNKVASKRIQMGLNVLVGDLVLASPEDELIEEVDADAVIESDNDEEEELTPKDDAQKTYPKVKVLQESDLPNYTIYDIVLPLPGYDVIYPENELKDYYKEILEKEGLTLEMPKQRVKTYTLSGAYRKVLGKLGNLSWKIMHYNTPSDNLILSDLEKINNVPEPTYPDGQYKAVILDFCLNPCCYATMVLREILKMDTSTSTHAKLNNYHSEGKKPIEQINNVSKKPQDTIEDESSSLVKSEKYSAFLETVFGTDSKTEAENGNKRSLEEGEESDSKKVKN